MQILDSTTLESYTDEYTVDCNMVTNKTLITAQLDHEQLSQLSVISHNLHGYSQSLPGCRELIDKLNPYVNACQKH
jgi:hypothetical protein